MVRRFIVNVNGTAYDVEVEEVGGVAGRPAAFVAPSPYMNAAPMYAAPAPAPVYSAPAASRSARRACCSRARCGSRSRRCARCPCSRACCRPRRRPDRRYRPHARQHTGH